MSTDDKRGGQGGDQPIDNRDGQPDAGRGEVNHQRRRFLTQMTCAVGGVGVACAAVPFVGSWQPSARARAAGAPVRVNLGKIAPGAIMVVEWRGRPVFIMRRTQQDMANIRAARPLVADPDSQVQQQPDYVSGEARNISGHEEYAVLVGLCTHLGCSPIYRTAADGDPAGGGQWHGGFYCPCHGSKFDLAGRVFKGVPAPTNMEVPPHRFADASTLIIGEDTGAA